MVRFIGKREARGFSLAVERIMAFEIGEYFEKQSGDIFQLVALDEGHFVLANTTHRSKRAAPIGQVWTREEFDAAMRNGFFRRMRTH